MSNPYLGYNRNGSGEPLLLLHGCGSTRADFTSLMPDLVRDFDVLALDLPGHGESPMIEGRPSVAALTDAVIADLDGLDRVHVLGNFLGGGIAVELACRDHALSVVSISPSGLGARFTLLPVSGHAPQSDAPQTIMDLVHRVADRAALPSATAAA